MAFDGIITKSVVTELKNSIINAKVNKIFEPTKSEILLSLYNNGSNYLLNLCIDPDLCRICLTNHQKSNPQNAYNFCMILRKYLVGGRIINISNYDLERTVEIQFECYNELNDLVIRKLFIEIMSRQSNIILTNENNIIIDTLKHVDNSSRELLPAHEYTFTPITKTSFIDLQSFDEFKNLITSSEEISLTKILTNTFIGLSKSFISENLKILNIKDKEFLESDLEPLYNHLKQIIEKIGTPELVIKKIGQKDYTVILDNRHQDSTSINTENNLSTNFFLDDFYFNKEQLAIFNSYRSNLLKIVSNSLKKVYKKLENINQKLKECENMDTFRLYGELLTANLYKLNNNINLSSIELANYYNNNKIITIPLDSSITLQKNVDKYFKKYTKLKNALEVVSEQKKEAEKELDYIESIVFNLSNAKSINDINEVYDEISENILTQKELAKKEKNTQNKNSSLNNDKLKLESVAIDDFVVYIGKNNIQNDYLSLKFANANDIWFHAQKIHGSHVLLKNPENLDFSDIPENVLYSCANLAKENSKAALSTNVSVDYCYARYVKKVSGAKPGMVIYTNFKTIIVK